MGDQPSLLTFGEVETLLHEFGHGLQHMLTQVDEGLVSNVTGDIRITDDPASSDYAYVTWSGSELGIAWEDRRDGNAEIYFVTVDENGNQIGEHQRLANLL